MQEELVDIHCHVLTGLDDGPQEWEQSLEMARMAVRDGIGHVVCTPHWMHGSFNNTRERVLRAVDAFRRKLVEEDIPLLVYPGAELHLDFDIPARLASGEVLSINDTGVYALLELPDAVVPMNLRHFFWELQSQGVRPVIGHPERNHILMANPARLFKWVEMGALVQVTSASLLGRFGSKIQQFAVTLLKHNMVHVLATDAHSPTARTPRLTEGYRAAAKIIGEKRARELVVDTPMHIIQGEPVETLDPVPLASSMPKSFFSRVFPFIKKKSR